MECLYCKKDKPPEDFYPHNKSRCKVCVGVYADLRHRNHPVEEKARWRRYRERHKEKQAQYYRRWYIEHGRKRNENYKEIIILWQKNHPNARQVGRIVAQALRNGELEKPLFCSICGREARINAHHNDYNLPLEILWVCSSCHKKIHLEGLTNTK